MNDEKQPIKSEQTNGEHHPDTIENVPIVQRATPRNLRERFSEYAKTGNIAAWFIMKAMEPRFEFSPDQARNGETNEPVLHKPLDYGLEHYRVEDLHLDTGENVTAWYKPATKGYPTLVYCHGNAGPLYYRADMLKNITDRGFGLIIAAYPGFKGHVKRPKVAPSERGCDATGHAMVRHLLNEREVPIEKIVLFGESLGGAVALRTAMNIQQGIPDLGYEPLKAPPVICMNTFTSLVKRAKEQFPMLAANALMENRFESDKIIGKIDAPILLIHGKDDEYTPYQHSIDLQKASADKADLKLLDGVRHTCTYPGTKEIDQAQVTRVIDCAHQYLADLKICPPPQVKAGGAHHETNGKQWQEKTSRNGSAPPLP